MWRKQLIISLLMFLCSSSLFAFEMKPGIKVIKGSDRHIVTAAAEDLAYYLGHIMNTNIPVVSKEEGGTGTIVVSFQPEKDLPEDAFVIDVTKEQVSITGANERGVLFGVYYFLDHYLGCKFLAADYEYIPHFAGKVLPEKSDRQIPRFAYREIFIAEGDDPVFSFKNLLNGRLGHRIEKREAEKNYTTGIDTYSFISSQLISDRYACNGQYLFSDSSVKKEALIKLDKKLSEIYMKRQIYAILEHEDRGSVCERGLKKGETPQKAFLDYTSYLAKGLQKKYPKVKFYHQAYFWSRRAPADAKRLPSNLGVHFAPIEADFSQPLKSKTNSRYWQDLLSWKPLTDDVIVWHYITNFNAYPAPYPNLDALAQDLHDLGKEPFVTGLFLQGAYNSAGSELAELRLWVFARLLWNPNQNIETLIKEFCHYYYGKAADDVKHYIDTVAFFSRQSQEGLQAKTPVDAAYLSEEHLAKLAAILEKGLSKLKTESPYYKHLYKLLAGIDGLRLIRGDRFKDREKVKRRYKKYLDVHPEISRFGEAVSMENIKTMLDIDRSREKIPPLAKGLRKGTEWLSFQEYQLELCCADIVEDKRASDGVSAVMDGSSKEWGFSLPLVNIPEGVWDIYADVRVTRNKHTLLDKARWALRYGIAPDIVKGVLLSAQMGDGYRSIKMGTINTKKSHAEYLWLSPPGNQVIKKLYLDRIYFIKRR